MARNNLDIKRFSEYTKDEQKEIMFHWWYYYGKLPVSFDEMDRFQKLMDEDMDFVKNAALVAWAVEIASQDLVRAMRSDLDAYKKHIAMVTALPEFKEIEELLEQAFIEEVVRTYNNPEPAVPMTDEQLISGLVEALGTDVSDAEIIQVSAQDIEQDEKILTSDKVHEMHKKCLLSEKEFIDGEAVVDFTIGEGVHGIGVFSSQRLEENRAAIAAMIDELPDIEQGPSFVTLCCDKHGRQWTDFHSTMDLLMQLGMATETIDYMLPREVWPAIGGVPLVIRVHNKDNESLRTHAPKEFKKVKEEISSGTYRKGTK